MALFGDIQPQLSISVQMFPPRVYPCCRKNQLIAKQVRVNSSSKRESYSVIFSRVCSRNNQRFDYFPAKFGNPLQRGARCWASFVWPGSQHVGITCQHPFPVLLLEDRQRMTCTRHGLSPAGRSNNNGELCPHKGPIPENSDLLNLAPAVKSWSSLA